MRAPDLTFTLMDDAWTGDEPARMTSVFSTERRFRALVGANVDFVARSLRHLGVPDGDVEDAVQQVFLVAAKKLDDVPAAAERAFLFQTSLRIASRARRTQLRRREEGDGALVHLVDAAPTPEEALERQRSRDLLDVVLDGMPLELRTVLVLFELEELSTVEVAKILEIPVGTVKSRLRRARDEFSAGVQRLKLRNVRSAHGGG